MAKDLTISLGGRNPDGTISATIGGVDPGNPLLQGGVQAQTGLVPYTQQLPGVPLPTQQPYRVQVGNQTISFASEADWLRMEQMIKQYQQQVAPQAVANLNGSSSILGGDTNQWLRTGAHAAEAVSAFLRGRDTRRKRDDLEIALADSRDARGKLRSLSLKYPDLIPVLQDLFLAERDATEASIGALEDEITAVDIQTGAGVAKVAADLMGGRSLDSGTSTTLAVGGAGLGLGLLLSRDRDDDRRDRRRR